MRGLQSGGAAGLPDSFGSTPEGHECVRDLRVRPSLRLELPLNRKRAVEFHRNSELSQTRIALAASQSTIGVTNAS